jgi:hypothetical protein
MEIRLFPSWLLARLGVPRQIHREMDALLSSGFALFIALLLAGIPHVCLMQRLLHLPCPGCGVLHAMRATLQLQFGRAWSANPAGPLFTVFLCFRCVSSGAGGLWPRWRLLLRRLNEEFGQVVFAFLVVVWLDKISLGSLHSGSHLLSQM